MLIQNILGWYITAIYEFVAYRVFKSVWNLLRNIPYEIMKMQ